MEDGKQCKMLSQILFDLAAMNCFYWHSIWSIAESNLLDINACL